MGHSKIPVTVVVPVKNEERNLARCLSGLSRFSEVIVVDSGSTDATQKIAREAGAKILMFVWNGKYPKKRNWVLLSQKLGNNWVLFLDADEFVTTRFCDEVNSVVSSGRHVGYWINYTNYFLGRRLRYGVPQKKLALFKVGEALYERVEEEFWTALDMEVHEHPIVNGSVGNIRNPVEHNDDRGIDKFLVRHLEYARWEARRTLALKTIDRLGEGRLTGRQKLKYRNIERWWYPGAYFFYTYIVKLGMLDGVSGFQYAVYKSWYFLTIRLLIVEIRADEHSVSSHG